MALTTREITDNDIRPILLKYAGDQNNTLSIFIDSTGQATTFGGDTTADALPIASEGQIFLRNFVDNLNNKLNLNLGITSDANNADIRIMNHNTSLLGDNASGVNAKRWSYRGTATNPTFVDFDYNDISINLNYGDESTNSWKSTAIHELGHALGLEHPFDADDGDVYGTTYSTSVDLTLMAYGEPANGIDPISYTALDIAALQGIWGEEINDAPVLTGATANLPAGQEDNSYFISKDLLLQGYSDPDGDTLSIAGLSSSTGSLSESSDGTTYTFTPAANYQGSVELTYTVSDRLGGTLQANNRFTLIDVNDAPTSSGVKAVLSNGLEDTPFRISRAQLTQGFSDIDGDTLIANGLTSSVGTTLANADGSFTITTPADFHGPVSVTYSVSDGRGGSIAASNTFTLLNRNDKPVLTSSPADLPNGVQGTKYRLRANDLTQGFSDPDGDTLTINNLRSRRGSFSKKGAQGWTFKAKSGFFGDVSFRYDLEDGQGGKRNVRQQFSLEAKATPPIIGTTANDRLIGTRWNDRVLGKNGRDTLIGGKGDDRLDAGQDDGRKPDQAKGGKGSDTFVIHPRGRVQIKDFKPKHDSLDLSAVPGWSWSIDDGKTSIFNNNGDQLAILNKAPDLSNATVL